MLPKDKSVTMREVREIDTARATLKKEEEEAMKKRIAARNKVGPLAPPPHSAPVCSCRILIPGLACRSLTVCA